MGKQDTEDSLKAFDLTKIDGQPTALDGLPVMTKAELLAVALEHGGYSTPSLCDNLYLHFKGYQRIENLEEYTGLKSLWLHSNGLRKIENINHLKQLRCLFLQRNSLTVIDNLHGLESLCTLDLSENKIKLVEGLSTLTNLTTLNLSKNSLENAASIEHLAECNNLSAVDLSHNQLAGANIVECIAGISKLTSLGMSGNPVCSKVAFFRKKMIVANKSLRYLDRPVFDNERETAEEWARAGPEAERELKEKLLAMKRDEERKATQEFRQWQEYVRASHVKEASTNNLITVLEEIDDLVEIDGETGVDVETSMLEKEGRITPLLLEQNGQEKHCYQFNMTMSQIGALSKPNDVVSSDDENDDAVKDRGERSEHD